MEIDAECQIPGCDGTKCGQSRTTIAKIRKVKLDVMKYKLNSTILGTPWKQYS